MKVRTFPTIDPIATGARIEALRKARGLTVRDVQVYFGFDAPQAVYKWQKGTALPSVDNLLALSALLGVPMESILVSHSVTFLTADEPEGSFFMPVFPSASSRARKNALLPRLLSQERGRVSLNRWLKNETRSFARPFRLSGIHLPVFLL